MTNLQRILALDAALCAAECTNVPANLRAAFVILADELDAYFNDLPQALFEDFLEQQLESVKLLASNPQTFGC